MPPAAANSGSEEIVGKALAGEAVSLVVNANAHLRSLADATAHVVAQRTGGVGHYELQLQFNPARMDATLSLREPASGPLENLAKIPCVGNCPPSPRFPAPGPRKPSS